MVNTYTIDLAIVDFIPNILFLFATLILWRAILKLNGKRSNSSTFWVLGGLLIVVSGIMKATWKLIMAINGTSIDFLQDYLFLLQTIGFSITIAALVLEIQKLKPAKTNFQSTIIPSIMIILVLVQTAELRKIFMILSILLSGIMFGMLAYLSFKHHCRGGAYFFICAFLGLCMMGGLARGELTITLQWIAELVNITAEALFLIGSRQFYQFGCTD